MKKVARKKERSASDTGEIRGKEFSKCSAARRLPALHLLIALMPCHDH